MRRTTLLAAIFVMVGLVGALLFKYPAYSFRAQTEPQVARPCCAKTLTTAPRQLEFPYYSLRDGFSSTILLVGGSPNPLEFVMGIHSRSGQTVLAPAMTIQPLEKLTVDLATLLTELSADVTGDFAEGSVSIYFNGTVMPLAGQLTMSNPARRLILESEMVDNAPGLGLLPAALHGVWWGLGGGRDAQIIVTNTSGEAAQADVFLDFLAERHPSAPLVLAPHETKVLSIAQLLGDLKLSPAQAPEGGITIIPRGPKPALIAQGKITDPTSGFSTSLTFPDPSMQRASALHASGVPIGTPTKHSPYAGTGTFIPHVIVRNLTSSPQSVSLTIYYPTVPTSGRSGEAASPDPSNEPGTQQATLAPVTLGPYETRDVSLDDAFTLLPLPLPFCSIRIQYSGAPGSVVAEVTSIELGGDLVMDSRVANEGNGWAGSGAHPWHLDEETESIHFLTNMGDREVRIGYVVSAAGVNYYLTNLKLKPHETRAIDLRKLRDAQEPDFQGNKLPAGATDGSVLWNRIEHVPVMGQFVVLQRRRGMASPYTCWSCNCGISFLGVLSVSPSTVNLLPGQSAQEVATGTYLNCNGCFLYYTVTTSANWWSGNPTIATVNNSTQKGRVTGQSGGSTPISSSFTDNSIDDSWYPDYSCHYYPVTGNGTATANVYTFTVSVSPAAVQPRDAGSAQTTVTVQTSPAVSGEQVTLQAQEVQYSGGHNHQSRPLGSFGASSGTTNANGRFQTTYTASRFGGQEVIRATIEGATQTATLTVQVAGLTQLADGADFDLMGGTSYHVFPSNHYGTSGANASLVAIGNDFAAQYPGSVLWFNDQSLPSGGLFDIGPPYGSLWQTPHSEHRLGTNCDVSKSNVPSERWDVLEEIFTFYASQGFLEESDHWHLRL